MDAPFPFREPDTSRKDAPTIVQEGINRFKPENQNAAKYIIAAFGTSGFSAARNNTRTDQEATIGYLQKKIKDNKLSVDQIKNFVDDIDEMELLTEIVDEIHRAVGAGPSLSKPSYYRGKILNMAGIAEYRNAKVEQENKKPHSLRELLINILPRNND